MTIEPASTHLVEKPWGSTDLRPWNKRRREGTAIGEIWFERSDRSAQDPALLLKLLFTTAPLSIQVHPDDAFARSAGFDHGKTEAWYILSAAQGASVATGLKLQITIPQLRAAIEDGSVVDLVHWRKVAKDDIIFVPAGTIHSIGAGLVLAEIQQRCDVTYRLFDYGRHRELGLENAVAVADAGPAATQPAAARIADGRNLLVANMHFVFERLDLPTNSIWELDAAGETWLLALEGDAHVRLLDVSIGDAVFLEADRADIRTGPEGLKGLLAYLGPHPDPGILQDRHGRTAVSRLDDPHQPVLHRRLEADLRGVRS